MRTFRAELLRVLSRGSGLFFLLCLALGLFSMLNAPGQHQTPLWGFRQASIFIATLLMARAATVAAADYSTGTIRPWLIAAPRRGRVVVEKLLASLTVGVLFSVFAGIAAYGFSSAQGTVPALRDDLQTTAWLAIAAIGFTLFGHAVGVLTSSIPAALGITLAWVLPGEAVLSGPIKHADKVLPGTVTHDITLGDLAHGLSWPIAVAHALVPFLILEIAAIVWFVRRDVTS
jgi:hypothetical protein